VHPKDVTVGSVKLRVYVHESLHVVLPGRDVSKALRRPTQVGTVDNGNLTRHELVDVPPEERLSGATDL
jgi:hypothetical protein